ERRAAEDDERERREEDADERESDAIEPEDANDGVEAILGGLREEPRVTRDREERRAGLASGLAEPAAPAFARAGEARAREAEDRADRAEGPRAEERARAERVVAKPVVDVADRREHMRLVDVRVEVAHPRGEVARHQRAHRRLDGAARGVERDHRVT